MRQRRGDLHVCASCRFPSGARDGVLRPGASLLRAVRGELERMPLPGLEVHAASCLGPCDDACNAVLDVPGHRTFLATRLTAAEAPLLLRACARALTGIGAFGDGLAERSRVLRGWKA